VSSKENAIIHLSLFTWFLMSFTFCCGGKNWQVYFFVVYCCDSCCTRTQVSFYTLIEFLLIPCICRSSARTLCSQRSHLATELDNVSIRLRDDGHDDRIAVWLDDWKQATKKVLGGNQQDYNQLKAEALPTCWDKRAKDNKISVFIWRSVLF